MFCRYSELTIFMKNEQSVVILWVSWCKNKSFWQRFTCTQSVFFPTNPEPEVDQQKGDPEKSSEVVPEISETPTEQSTEQFLVEEPVVEPVVEPAVQPTGIEPEGLDPAVDPTVDPGAEAPAVEISGEVDKDFVLDNRSGAPVVQNDTKEETEITGKSFSEALITLWAKISDLIWKLF